MYMVQVVHMVPNYQLDEEDMPLVVVELDYIAKQQVASLQASFETAVILRLKLKKF